MSAYGTDGREERRVCAACGSEPAPYAVWGERLGPNCFDALQAVEAFTTASIGTSDPVKFCVEATARTRAWVASRRKPNPQPQRNA
jgi:hypothetical protein